ncbi:MerR family transcriptional regulator [Actinokineospora sp.]|uniref:MerR family transcriptional regulator n=1 Tax=Actinokineospora sp. TaxID=1872133 RepID=UPI004038010E
MVTKSEPVIPGSATAGVPPAGDEPTLPVAAVARRLGIAPATLRTWDRRYGVGPSGHTTGSHRRYGPADIARLELMQRALLKGVAPAEAAEYALRLIADDAEIPTPARGDADLAGPGGLDAELESAFAAAEPARHGGRRLALPGGTPAARGFGRAALAMDDDAAQRMLLDAIGSDGVAAVWDGVIRPVLAAVAGRWAHAGDGVEVEHLIHESALAAMIRATPLLPTPRNPRPVLLACVPGDRHSLPLYVLRAALARRGIGTLMLGATVPSAAIAAAVRRTAPAAVVLWAQVPAYGDAAVFDQLPRTRQRVHVFACGPGWFDLDLPGRAERLDGLLAAVDRIEAFVLGDPDSSR